MVICPCEAMADGFSGEKTLLGSLEHGLESLVSHYRATLELDSQLNGIDNQTMLNILYVAETAMHFQLPSKVIETFAPSLKYRA